MNKIFPVLIVVLSSVLFMASGNTASTVGDGILIKGVSYPAVYYQYNEKRYAFPNEKTFFTWYRDFSEVRTVSDEKLASIPLGGNVTYRPGTQLVKITTDPKVYAVASNGVLRWITSEVLAVHYFGPNWNRIIDDVPDTFFTNYQLGEPISQMSDYIPLVERDANPMFIPPARMSAPLTPIPVPTPAPKTPTVWDLYHQAPSQADIDSITKDFRLFWQDEAGQVWPNDYRFDQSSREPSKIVIISKLRALRDQQFSEPMPFTNGLSIYDYVKKYLSYVPLGFTCPTGLQWSVWDARSSGDCLSAESPTLYPYTYQLQVFVHEARHSEPGDPDHSTCGLLQWKDRDQSIDNGSGYAAATLYLMWVYKYSINESDVIREAAKIQAADFLKNRFCTKPASFNPKVQALIDELLK